MTSLRPAVHVASVVALLVTACEDSETFPDEWTFVMNEARVCMPSGSHTGLLSTETPPPVPVVVDFCLDRCLAPVPGGETLHSEWVCEGGDCRLFLMPVFDTVRVDGESGCSRDRVTDPPPQQCLGVSHETSFIPPCCVFDEGLAATAWVRGGFSVIVPHVTFDETEDVLGALEEGVGLIDTLVEHTGNAVFPARQFSINFDPGHPVAFTGADLVDADCHDIVGP